MYNDAKKTNDTCALSRVQKDTPNKIEEQVVEVSNAEDANCEAWVQELYDPHFSEFLIPVSTCKVEIDEVCVH